MATIATSQPPQPRDLSALWNPAALFSALGSLKLTVSLFAMSLVIVLVGTLAQDELNMLEVKQRYFLTWVAWVHFDDFFPQAFYPHDEPIPGVLPFPGGATIGLLLMLNLVAAKTTRFKMQARGGKRLAGIGFLAAGAAVAGLIIASGHNSDGLQGTPPISYEALWGGVLVSLVVATAALAMAAVRIRPAVGRVALAGSACLVGGYVLYSLITGDRIDDPGLRIVWQLTKGLGAGLILLVGCQLLFAKQGGNVLLHLGVGLLMLGQFIFGDRQLEQRLSLVEGESTNTFVNLDKLELAFIHTVDDVDRVTAVPAERLSAVAGTGRMIRSEELPVDVKVLQFFDNSDLEQNVASPPELADTGLGLEWNAVERAKSGGTDSKINLSSAYIELFAKDSQESLGRFLVSQFLNDFKLQRPDLTLGDLMDEVEIGDKTYQFGLRLHREVKPYWVQLEDVRRIDYSGTNTPRDYSSFIRLVDEETGEDRRERVWMNNPLRYRGETFYQSNYTQLPGGKEMTGIQVVQNSGWLIPYLACSITGLGMLVHFWGTLTRFLSRRRREVAREFDSQAGPAAISTASPWPTAITFGIVAFLSLIALTPRQSVMNQLRPAARDQGLDLHSFGQLPVQFGGRVMPLEAYARQTLRSISNKESLPLDDAPGDIRQRAIGKRLSALQWLAEVASDDPKIYYLPMFRIDADEVLSELGLDRKESKLYSYEEITKNEEQVRKLTAAAFEKQENTPERMEFKEKKLIELELRKRQFLTAAIALRAPRFVPFPDDRFPEATDQQRQMFMVRQIEEIDRQMKSLASMNAPSVIPPPEEVVDESVDQPKWDAYANAYFDSLRSMASGRDSRAEVQAFGEVIDAYRAQDETAFNDAVDRMAGAVQAYPIPGYVSSKVSLEHWYNASHPTTLATAIYLLAMILGLIYFAVDSERLRGAVWGTLLVAFLIHTATLAARIYITGRAPVINIYSSAVFVGWAAVLFGLVLERIFRYGTGNMLAAVAGMLTLRVAYGLQSGDTMPVLQAVLDTQFWLTTHVISVSLGYVATMVGGTLGIGYLIAGWCGGGQKLLRDIYRCVYGAACFGILFSFIGTVLGGLWADDSWGRFWGWDPKENGALLIVIWNALMLHARWDGMVGGRGFSILAIGGNIVTAWSWFGTNELGIGLHSYGFTEGVLMWLTIYMASQLAFIIAGLAFRRSSEPTP